MFPCLFDEKFFVNRFTETQLPTKSQIFARTGQKAVAPAGAYTGEEPVAHKLLKTESAEAFVKSVEAFEVPKSVDDGTE